MCVYIILQNEFNFSPCRLHKACAKPGRQVAVATKFRRGRLMFVGPQEGTCFMSLPAHVEF